MQAVLQKALMEWPKTATILFEYLMSLLDQVRAEPHELT